MILNFLFLPITMFLMSSIFFGMFFGMCAVLFSEKCCKVTKTNWTRGNCFIRFLYVLLGFIWTVLFLPFCLALGALMTALVIVPAYFFQFYRLIKILSIWYFRSGAKVSKSNKDKDLIKQDEILKQELVCASDKIPVESNEDDDKSELV